MSYSFACADTGASCPGSFATESKDELMEHVMLHTERAHSEFAGNAELGATVQSLIKQA